MDEGEVYEHPQFYVSVSMNNQEETDSPAPETRNKKNEEKVIITAEEYSNSNSCQDNSDTSSRTLVLYPVLTFDYPQTQSHEPQTTESETSGAKKNMESPEEVVLGIEDLKDLGASNSSSAPAKRKLSDAVSSSEPSEKKSKSSDISCESNTTEEKETATVSSNEIIGTPESQSLNISEKVRRDLTGNSRHVKLFRDKWLEIPEFKGWLSKHTKKNRKGDDLGFCLYCDEALGAEKEGLRKHSDSAKHKANAAAYNGSQATDNRKESPESGGSNQPSQSPEDISNTGTKEDGRKSSRYLKLFRDTWLEMPEFKGWLTKHSKKNRKGDDLCFCLYCDEALGAEKEGLRKHSESVKHKANSDVYFGKQTAMIEEGPSESPASDELSKTNEKRIRINQKCYSKEKRFQKKWLQVPEFKGWLSKHTKKSRKGHELGYCLCCEEALGAQRKGLIRHSESAKHRANFATYNGLESAFLPIPDSSGKGSAVIGSPISTGSKGPRALLASGEQFQNKWLEIDDLKGWLFKHSKRNTKGDELNLYNEASGAGKQGLPQYSEHDSSFLNNDVQSANNPEVHPYRDHTNSERNSLVATDLIESFMTPTGEEDHRSLVKGKRFQNKWFQVPEFKDWLAKHSRRSSKGHDLCYCLCCEEALGAQKKGLVRHSESSKHKTNFALYHSIHSASMPDMNQTSPNLALNSSDVQMAISDGPSASFNSSGCEFPSNEKARIDQLKNSGKGKRFQNKWLEMPEFQYWLSKHTKKSKKGDDLGYCVCCDEALGAQKEGLRKHSESAKHKANFALYSDIQSSDIERKLLETVCSDQPPEEHFLLVVSDVNCSGDDLNSALTSYMTNDTSETRGNGAPSSEEKRKNDPTSAGKVKRFQDKWLEMPEFRDWLIKHSKRSNKGDELGYCICCDEALGAQKEGLRKHSESAKHKANFSLYGQIHSSNIEKEPPEPLCANQAPAEHSTAVVPYVHSTDESYSFAESSLVSTCENEISHTPEGKPSSSERWKRGEHSESSGRGKRFQDKWLQSDEFKGWLSSYSKKNRKGDDLCYCLCCDEALGAQKKGLQRHAESAKHKANFASYYDIQTGDSSEVTNFGKTKGRKFRDKWLEIDEFKGWLSKHSKQSRKGDDLGFCLYCDEALVAEKEGLRKHSESAKHKANSAAYFAGETADFEEPPNPGSTQSKIHIAELKLWAFLASKQLPISLSDDLVPFLKSLFPDSNILKNLKLNRAKASELITDSLAATFEEEIKEELKDPSSFFSLIMNEATDMSDARQRAITAPNVDSNFEPRNDCFDSASVPSTNAVDLSNAIKKPRIT